MYTAFIKWTFYGVFIVKQEENGRWVATRYTKALLCNGEEATFATSELARHVVDLHERDDVANYPAIDDGYSWEIDPGLPGRSQANAHKVSFSDVTQLGRARSSVARCQGGTVCYLKDGTMSAPEEVEPTFRTLTVPNCGA